MYMYLCACVCMDVCHNSEKPSVIHSEMQEHKPGLTLEN